ncbi:MAG: urease accessory protein UreD, partial [Pseudomonadota bacterium]
MSVVTSPSDPTAAAAASGPMHPLQPIRVNGGVELGLTVAISGRTVAARRVERDGYKLRTPNRADACEVAIINTGGGIAGGDRVTIAVDAGPGADAVVAAPQAERIYKAASTAPATYAVRLRLAAHARLDWLPQETILFDGARIVRTIDVDMDPTARIVIGECVVFGRTARDEAFASGRFSDRWRFHRSGALVHAEAFDTDALRDAGNLDSGRALLSARPALGPACAFGTLVALGGNADDLLPAVRACL